MFLKRKRGYTLIEMIVVVAIICILTALAMPEVNGMTEKNQLKVAEEMVRQAIVEARTMSIAPKGGATGMSTVSGFEASFYTNITGKTSIGTGAGAKNYYPIMIRGVITQCDDETKVLSRQELKNFEFPDTVVIDKITPMTKLYFDSIQASPASPVVDMSSVRFKLTDFSVKCGGSNKAAGPEVSAFWGGSEIYQIRLKNLRIKDNQQEFGYVNVNKYSGQVWISQEKDALAKVVVPQDGDHDSYGQAVFYNGLQYQPNNFLQINNSQNGWLLFRMNNLETSDKTKFPKTVRVWLTTRLASGSMNVYLQDPNDYKDKVVGNDLLSSSNQPVAYDNIKDVLVKTLTLKNSNQISFDINLAKYKDKWLDGTDYNFSRPLVLLIKSNENDEKQIWTRMGYQSTGPVELNDSDGLMVRPAPFVEFIY